jgi:hypothetical protein
MTVLRGGPLDGYDAPAPPAAAQYIRTKVVWGIGKNETDVRKAWDFVYHLDGSWPGGDYDDLNPGDLELIRQVAGLH